MAKIRVDQDKCIGCQLCADICSETFVMKGDKAVTKRSEVDNPIAEKEAADTCPVEAIIIS